MTQVILKVLFLDNSCLYTNSQIWHRKRNTAGGSSGKVRFQYGRLDNEYSAMQSLHLRLTTPRQPY